MLTFANAFPPPRSENTNIPMLWFSATLMQRNSFNPQLTQSALTHLMVIAYSGLGAHQASETDSPPPLLIQGEAMSPPQNWSG